MKHLTLLCLAIGAASLVACSSSDDDTSQVATTDTAGEADSGTDTTSEPDGSGSADDDAVSDTGGTDNPFDIAAIFHECEETADCPPFGAGEPQQCINNVCLVPARQPAELADEDSFEPLTSPPNVACYASDQSFFTPGTTGPATAKLRGDVERFGSGSRPADLCVSVYAEERLLPYLYFSECRELEGDDDDAFIACFQLDACRCEAAFSANPQESAEMVAAAEDALQAAGAEDTSIDSQDECFSFIGYCGAIQDADIRTACFEHVRAKALVTGDESVVLAHVKSVADPANPDNDESGWYEQTTEVPTNLRIAFKVSGKETRWRDTWEYGLYTASDNVDAEGFLKIGANTVSDGAWRTIPPAVGLAGGIDDTHGAVAGTIRDCGDPDRTPANPQRIVHATVGISFDGNSTLSYFNGNPDDTLPLPGRIDTNSDGTYAAIDLPSGPQRVSPIICVNAPCQSDADFIQAGTRNVFQTPKSIIIATFEPYR